MGSNPMGVTNFSIRCDIYSKTNTMSKATDFFNKIGYWFTDGGAKGTGILKLILLGLTIITPLFLIMAAPWLAWTSISPEYRFDEKYYWLQDFMIAWPIVIFALGFFSVIGKLIYNYVKDTK